MKRQEFDQVDCGAVGISLRNPIQQRKSIQVQGMGPLKDWLRFFSFRLKLEYISFESNLNVRSSIPRLYGLESQNCALVLDIRNGIDEQRNEKYRGIEIIRRGMI